MLAMMFNYINEETVMAAGLLSCWKPLYLDERRERRRGRRGRGGQKVRMDSLSIIMWTVVEVVVVVVVGVVVSVCVGVSYWT